MGTPCRMGRSLFQLVFLASLLTVTIALAIDATLGAVAATLYLLPSLALTAVVPRGR